MMNWFQVQVTAVYADGAYAPLANSETWQRDVDELGDGLLKYVILELSTERTAKPGPKRSSGLNTPSANSNEFQQPCAPPIWTRNRTPRIAMCFSSETSITDGGT